jgi:hypothetical protein
VCKDVTLLSSDGRKKYLTYMYNIVQRIVADNPTRAGALGTMFQEHLHALLRRGCHGDARLSTIDLAMTSVVVKQQLRAWAGVDASFGACNKRQQGAEVTFPVCRQECEPPILGHVMRQVVASLRRTVVFLPREVEHQLALQGIDVTDLREFDANGAGARPPTFLHELLGPDILKPPRRAGASATTIQAKVTATGGLGRVKPLRAAQQMGCPG